MGEFQLRFTLISHQSNLIDPTQKSKLMRSQAKVAGIQSQFLHQCHWCAEKMKFQLYYNSGFGVQINDVGYATNIHSLL